MWTAEIVLVCALNLLGRSASSFPPIEFTATAPVGASRWVEAYVGPIDRKIYIITTTDSFLRWNSSKMRSGEITRPDGTVEVTWLLFAPPEGEPALQPPRTP